MRPARSDANEPHVTAVEVTIAVTNRVSVSCLERDTLVSVGALRQRKAFVGASLCWIGLELICAKDCRLSIYRYCRVTVASLSPNFAKHAVVGWE